MATLQILMVVGGAAIVGAIFWGMAFSAAAQMMFGMSEMESMLFVFLPSSMLMAIYLSKSLPAPLRKAGMLSDPPSRFGPWFRSR